MTSGCPFKGAHLRRPHEHRHPGYFSCQCHPCGTLAIYHYCVSSDHVLTATLAVIDVETTGLSPEYDRVVEIACLRVERGRIVDRLATLVDPGISIPPSASAVHGIFNRDVADAPRLESLVARIDELARGATIVAHNARFDLGFLPFLAHRPAICTLQLARRLVDAPNYRNDFLCDFLELAIDRDLLTAHRAESDARVTAELATKLFGNFAEHTHEPTIEVVLDFLDRPMILDQFAFGSYRGVRLCDVPTSYLQWIVSADFAGWPDVRHSATIELARRRTAFSVR